MPEEPLQIDKLQNEMVIPSISRYITQEKIKAYAEASLDFNPIHINPEFAARTPLGGTIAHGMLSLGYVSHMMTVNFSKAWIETGRLNVRFKAPARPGDTVMVSGVVREVEGKEGHVSVVCEVLCQNDKGETVISGEASFQAEVS